MSPIAIYGAKGFGAEVLTIVEHINRQTPTWDVVGLFDDGIERDTIVHGRPVLGGREALNEWPEPLWIVIAIGAPAVRKRVAERITNPAVRFARLVHPSVIVGDEASVSIGAGSIVCAGCILTTDVEIGAHAILNLSCMVGHGARLGEYASLMQSCNVSGDVVIERETYLGTGSVILQGIRIGAGSTVGAGAVVTRDIPAGVTAVGVPARVLT